MKKFDAFFEEFGCGATAHRDETFLVRDAAR